MTGLSAKERGDMAEDLLPKAAHLAVLVHGDGGPEDVREVLDSLDDAQRTALIVVLAGLVDPDQPMGKALGWLDFNEHGQTVVPAWGSRTTVRDMAPEPELDDETYVDPVAVRQYLEGKPLVPSPRERLEAIVTGVRRGMTYPDFDRMHHLKKGSTSTFISRTRRAYAAQGIDFPDMTRPDGEAKAFTTAQVVEMRERYAAGGVSEMDLAMSYGGARSVITRVLTGESYRSAGGPLREKRENRPGVATRLVWNGDKGPHLDSSTKDEEEIAA